MPKVMIIDDDRTTVGLLETLLELDGFEVVSVGDGSSAFEKAKSENPDAFLVDYHLADIDGTEFVRQIRADAEFGEIPVIMTSGLNRETEAREAGANYFLIKPFDPNDLVSVLKSLLS